MSEGFLIKNYQKQKPFSSFLSGIAGLKGIPIWAFYVNRGQAITSFGIRDKNGAIQEFFPANAAYYTAAKLGFRTFIKVDNKVYEFFKEENKEDLIVYQEKLVLEEENKRINIKLRITYFILPNEELGALVRKVEIFNLGEKKRSIEIIDGLTQILPSGVDYGGFKAVSNLLQSWMQVEVHDKFLFYKLRSSTGDTVEMKEQLNGNFYSLVGVNNKNYLYDYKALYHNDSAFTTPYGFIKNDYDQFVKLDQALVNQVPMASSIIKEELNDSISFYQIFGYADNLEKVNEFTSKIDNKYLDQKLVEIKEIHDDLLKEMVTTTKYPNLNEYFRQCYLDNILRGGKPLILDSKDGSMAYHVYSRRHGDLERDYNFFSIEPNFYSQGGTNFRDVLQNRRNDIYFNPEVKDSIVYHFGNLFQADGFNPLSVEGLLFRYEGKEDLSVLKKDFSIGELARELHQKGLDIESGINRIIKDSKIVINARFGEGYWNDHFTYFQDLIDNFLDIYPDLEKEMLFARKYHYFKSPIEVLPRSEKSILVNDTVKQVHALKHFEDNNSWLLDENKNLVTTNLYGKLLTLAINKFLELDQNTIGLSYEAGKPGWNDAMNGLPGLYGSGVSEMFELRRIVDYLLSVTNKYGDIDVKVLNILVDAAKKLQKRGDDSNYYDFRMDVLEDYRHKLYANEFVNVSVKISDFKKTLTEMKKVLEKATHKAKSVHPIYPTYLTYEVKGYDLVDSKVIPKDFLMKPLPLFLEAPARYIKSYASKKEAKEIYDSVKKTGIYDEYLKQYRTSESLDDWSIDIGRIRAFTKGWLERESNFMHMTFKYLLALLKSGLNKEFFKEIESNYPCFMKYEVYGRPLTENSSFIATSNNPDKAKWGTGYVSRLTGSTAEVLSMWKLMFLGDKLFSLQDDELVFTLNPKLPNKWFVSGMISTKFNDMDIIYYNEDGIDLYHKDAYIEKIKVDGKDLVGTTVSGLLAEQIRDKKIKKIEVFYKRRKEK